MPVMKNIGMYGMRTSEVGAQHATVSAVLKVCVVTDIKQSKFNFEFDVKHDYSTKYVNSDNQDG